MLVFLNPSILVKGPSSGKRPHRCCVLLYVLLKRYFPKLSAHPEHWPWRGKIEAQVR